MYRFIYVVFARSVGVILSCSSNDLGLIPRPSLYITQELEIQKKKKKNKEAQRKKEKRKKNQMFDSEIDRSRV